MTVPIGIVGAGSFGTALAVLLGGTADVALWAREGELAEAAQRTRRNPVYLPEFLLPDRVRVTASLADALRDREVVICAVPSHGLRAVMTQAVEHLAPGSIVVCATKGLEEDTGLTMNDVLEQLLPEAWHPRLVALSGPSFAREIAARRPTAVTLAGRVETYALAVQVTVSRPWFRCYTSDDPLGVQLAGGLKNVVALAAGLSDGLGLGPDSRAALVTRGLGEIARLGVRLGARPLTFLGLAGVGDLILTCTTDLSRNRTVGLELGRGRKLADVLAGLRAVAEGVRTTHAACALATRLGLEVPVAAAVRDVLEGRRSPGRALRGLMTRPLESESHWLEAAGALRAPEGERPSRAAAARTGRRCPPA